MTRCDTQIGEIKPAVDGSNSAPDRPAAKGKDTADTLASDNLQLKTQLKSLLVGYTEPQ